MLLLLILWITYEDITIVFNIPLSDNRNIIVTDMTDKKHVWNRNEDIVRAKIN